jgi:hypothetical protein
MPSVKEAFVAALGKPSPRVPSAIHFEDVGMEAVWRRFLADVGSGWYLDRFLFLFGEGVERLAPCLDAWAFLVPPRRGDRKILGRNAHGALLVLEDAESVEHNQVHLLDPFRVTYWTDPDLNLFTLIGAWLPRKLLPGFLDDDLYRAWMQVRRRPLEDDLILAPKTPEGLGGRFEPRNVQEEEIVAYYRTTGPIYAKALGRAGSKRGARAEPPGKSAARLKARSTANAHPKAPPRKQTKARKR